MSKILKSKISVVMGSSSDWETMQYAVNIIKDFKIGYESKIISAHRTPERMFNYAKTARGKGIQIIIAGAGGAAHLPGMIAANTILPVLGVPVPTRYMSGIDSLYSILQMPKGLPVATFAIGEAGASNAALAAISILSINDESVAKKLLNFRENQTKNSLKMKLPD